MRKQGTSDMVSWLFYFRPDTNGVAYVIMIRSEYYEYYDSWSIQVTGPGGYSSGDSGTDVSEYLHSVRLDGLEAGETYTIKMSWLIDGEEAEYITIKRTYYCSNVTPPEHPYSDGDGDTTVPAYQTGYPAFCVRVKCPDNGSNEDGRCLYDEETRNLFWRVCATNYETHAVCSPMGETAIIRWPPGTVYVDVEYKSTQNQEAIAARINEWIEWMNGLVEFAGVKFELGSTTEKDARQINVIVGTHKQLWDREAEGDDVQVFGGTWESSYWGAAIIESQVKICCEDRYPFNYCEPAFEGIVFEELTEASGPGYDQFDLANTIFSEIAYPGKTVGGPPDADASSRERDENVIRMLYGLGYLKGEDSESTADSYYGSGIKFTKYYTNKGALSTNSQRLFFQLNISDGIIAWGEDETLPVVEDWLRYKSQRQYKLQAVYATEVPTTKKEETSGLSFRYTNPTDEGTPYFSLPKKPNIASSKRVDGGYKFGVTGLNTSGERYYVYAYLRDLTDEDVDNDSEYEFAYKSYSETSVTITGLLYGRSYDFYLYSWYDYIESDWIHIGEGVVAPKLPEISDGSNTDQSVTFTYDMGGTVFDKVVCKLYRSGTLIDTYEGTADSETVTMDFDKKDGNYKLVIYSVVRANDTDVQCVDSAGSDTEFEYNFSIQNRTYFYWSNYTSEVKSGGVAANVPYTAWNELVQGVRDIVGEKFSLTENFMPVNSSEYASGFGLAGGTSYETALTTYATISDYEQKELTAERFNIVNYIISIANPTGLTYKYNKSTKPTKVYASELIALQDKLNSI